MGKMSWRDLANSLSSFDETTVAGLLARELSEYKRPVVARRLHQRLCTLRAARERKDIMASVGR